MTLAVAGVDHDVLAAEALPPGTMAGVRVGRWHVLLVHTADGWHALNDRCPHAAARLSPGQLRQGLVVCPRHGARFDLASGVCAGQAWRAVPRFPVQVIAGRVIVTLPDRAPDMTETPID